MIKLINFIKKIDITIKKKIISDLGNFFSLLFFSNIDFTKGNMKQFNIWEIFCEEHLIRQMYWIFHNGHKILNVLEKIDIKKLEKEYPYIKEVENLKKEINSNKENYKIKIKENENSEFIEELKNNNIYNKVLDIICIDGVISSQGLPKNKIKKNISKRMNENFQILFDECTSGTKSKL